MNEKLEARLIRHEGLRTVPYLDSIGYWTIGVGHKITLDQAQNTYVNGVSRLEALDMLEQDIAICQKQANTLPWFAALCEARQLVIIEMIFQLGLSGLLEFKKMISAIENKEWEDAANQMLDSDWHKQTPSRCEELANIMLTGKDDE